MGLSVDIVKMNQSFDLASDLAYFQQVFFPSKPVLGANSEALLNKVQSDEFLAFRLSVLVRTLEIWKQNWFVSPKDES